MLLWLFEWLSQFYSPFSAVSSLSLRALLSVLTALGICIALGNPVIEPLARTQILGRLSVITVQKATRKKSARQRWAVCLF